MLKIVGAIMIVACCGWFGFSLVREHRRQEQIFATLLGALDYMGCELQYHLTPLPTLCRAISAHSKGVISQLFLALEEELDSQLQADAEACMENAISAVPSIPPAVAEQLRRLGCTLGEFDLQGQMQGLDAVRTSCRESLAALQENKEERRKSYQTLSLCAGAALVIIFI